MNGTPDFIDLRTRAEFLELCGDADGARRLQQTSLEIAREIDLVCYAYQLMWRERLQDAINLLQYAVDHYPDSWNVFHSLGEAWEQKGDFAQAIQCYRAAYDRADDSARREMILRRLNSISDLATAC
jgi:tetratricopeptide (TPR) repeat protein